MEERYNWNYTCYIYSKAFKVSKSEEDTIKVISINRKTKAQLQQTAAMRFYSSILAFTGKSDFQFSIFNNVNTALEPTIPGSEYAEVT